MGMLAEPGEVKCYFTMLGCECFDIVYQWCKILITLRRGITARSVGTVLNCYPIPVIFL